MKIQQYRHLQSEVSPQISTENKYNWNVYTVKGRKRELGLYSIQLKSNLYNDFLEYRKSKIQAIDALPQYTGNRRKQIDETGRTRVF